VYWFTAAAAGLAFVRPALGLLLNVSHVGGMDQTRVSRRGILVGALAATMSWAAALAGISGLQRDAVRGGHVMGVDQYTSAHVFEDLPTVAVCPRARRCADTAAIATIRGHMREIAA